MRLTIKKYSCWLLSDHTQLEVSSWYKPNLSCPLNCQQGLQVQKQDDQEHLLKCETLLAKLNPDQLKHIQGICYEDLYHDIVRQKLAVIGFSRLLEIRNDLLEVATPASGATLGAALSGGNMGLS